MAKSKKPEWLKRKISEGYARRAGKTARGLLNPEQRTLMDQIEKDAEAASAKRLAAALKGDPIIAMYHVPQ